MDIDMDMNMHIHIDNKVFKKSLAMHLRSSCKPKPSLSKKKMCDA